MLVQHREYRRKSASSNWCTFNLTNHNRILISSATMDTMELSDRTRSVLLRYTGWGLWLCRSLTVDLQ